MLTQEQLKELAAVDAGAAVLYLFRLRARHAPGRTVVQAERDVHACPGCRPGGTARARGRGRRGAAPVRHGGTTLSLAEIRERLGKGAGRTLDALAGEGILVYHSNTVQKTGDKTEKMLALDMESNEAMSRVRRSAARQDGRVRARGRHLDEPEGAVLHDGRERRRPA